MHFTRCFHSPSMATALFLSGFLFPAIVVSLGINYGQIANNLPAPEKVVPLVKAIGASKVKLYDTNPRILKAFANTGVEFIVMLPNECLSDMSDLSEAQNWVVLNVQPYLPATNVTCISVGNEVLTHNDTSLSNFLLPAMQSIHTALVTLGLDKQVRVTTTHSLAVLEASYPPSSAVFRRDLAGFITGILEFSLKTGGGSPFLINAYPYFAYSKDSNQISLDFVLFEPNQGFVDPTSNLHYDNMLFAQIDAVYSALSSCGYKIENVHISETGWPSKGDNDEAGATMDNAKKYNGNLIKLISEKKGTPLKPDKELNIYVFALFNENMKPGPKSERNYGLFKPDGTPVYDLGFRFATSNTTVVGNSSNPQSPPVGTPPYGYVPSASGAGQLRNSIAPVDIIISTLVCWIVSSII